MRYGMKVRRPETELVLTTKILSALVLMAP